MDALGLAFCNGLINGCIDGVQRHSVFLGNGIGNQHTAGETQIVLNFESLGQFRRRVDPIIHLEAGLTGVESGELLCAIADHRHTLGLQILQSQAQIQNRLRTGTNHHHGSLPQFFQIGGDVHGGFCTPVHTANAAGSKHTDTGHMGNDHGGGNGGSTVLAPGTQNRQVPAGSLGNGLTLFAEIFNLFIGETGL